MSLSSDFAAVHDGHVRLAMLRLLADQPAYCANDSILHQAVNAVGLPSTRDQVRGHVGWLREMGVVTVQETGSGLMVVTLTERGGEVAAGRAVIKGIQRPAPR